jgi:hypothetical protein
MRAARVPALFAMIPNNHPNSLAAQRVRQPLAEAKPKASRLHVMLAAFML